MKLRDTIETEYRNSIFTYKIIWDNDTPILRVDILPNLKKYLDTIFLLLLPTIKNKLPPYLLDFSEIVRLLKKIYYEELKRVPQGLSIPEINDDIVTYLAYRTLGIDKLLPLLIDSQINEIYLDNPHQSLYVDHEKFGRIPTNIFLSSTELNKLIFIAKIMSNTLITLENPSLKTEIETDDFRVRISMDFPPLIPNGPTFNIRIVRNRAPLHIFLLHPNVPYYLSLILLGIALRQNIVIVGEPGSGKTTLASLLLKFLPSFWRIVVIEDVKELIIPTEKQKKIIVIRVNPFETLGIKYSKDREIIKLLHRTPDYVFIGELQSQEDNKAFFHAISTGIKGLATVHASNIHELLSRWINVYKLNPTEISHLDLIVIMAKKIKANKIYRVIDNVLLLVPEELGEEIPYEETAFMRARGLKLPFKFINSAKFIEREKKKENAIDYLFKLLLRKKYVFSNMQVKNIEPLLLNAKRIYSSIINIKSQPEEREKAVEEYLEKIICIIAQFT